MPSLGLGVLFAKNYGEVENAVQAALDIGYRKIDTASAYQNEEGVGQAIADSSVDRSDIFLTTKVWNTEQGYDKTLNSFQESLERLQTNYIDLYLIHWPVKNKFIASYRALEELYAQKKVRAIGVCNFNIQQLEYLMQHSEIVPAINQVEMHPHLSQNKLLEYCKNNTIQVEAWRPIMMGEVLNIPELVEIGKAHGKSPVQIALRWLIQRGVAAIPKSVTPNRLAENFNIYDFELNSDQMLHIESLNQNRRLGEDLSHIE